MDINTEYEKLTQVIYQTLLTDEGVKTINVQHDVKIKGKAEEHQIDVYYEYELAGIRHRVAIECKNHNKPISKTYVSSFYGVLVDIGNIIGIIVTKTGYQKGAKNFAEHYGINLIELREPNDEDWTGRLKTSYTAINIIKTCVTYCNVLFDGNWVKKNNYSLEKVSENFKPEGNKNELWVKNVTGNPIKNFLQLENELPTYDGQSAINLTYRHEIEDGYFDVKEVGLVKLKFIEYTYDISGNSIELIMDGSKTAKAILKDALTGNLKFINKDGTIK